MKRAKSEAIEKGRKKHHARLLFQHSFALRRVFQHTLVQINLGSVCLFVPARPPPSSLVLHLKCVVASSAIFASLALSLDCSLVPWITSGSSAGQSSVNVCRKTTSPVDILSRNCFLFIFGRQLRFFSCLLSVASPSHQLCHLHRFCCSFYWQRPLRRSVNHSWQLSN